jgi:hypothetical protein
MEVITMQSNLDNPMDFPELLHEAALASGLTSQGTHNLGNIQSGNYTGSRLTFSYLLETEVAGPRLTFRISTLAPEVHAKIQTILQPDVTDEQAWRNQSQDFVWSWNGRIWQLTGSSDSLSTKDLAESLVNAVK